MNQSAEVFGPKIVVSHWTLEMVMLWGMASGKLPPNHPVLWAKSGWLPLLSAKYVAPFAVVPTYIPEWNQPKALSSGTLGQSRTNSATMQLAKNVEKLTLQGTNIFPPGENDKHLQKLPYVWGYVSSQEGKLRKCHSSWDCQHFPSSLKNSFCLEKNDTGYWSPPLLLLLSGPWIP